MNLRYKWHKLISILLEPCNIKCIYGTIERDKTNKCVCICKPNIAGVDCSYISDINKPDPDECKLLK